MPETAPFHEQTSAQELSESAQKGTLRHHRLHLDPSARDKTWGEKRFDAKTYIGIGLIGNEVASFGIGTAIKEGNFAHALYKKFEGLFSDLKRFTTAEGTPRLHRYIVGSEGRAPRLALPCGRSPLRGRPRRAVRPNVVIMRPDRLRSPTEWAATETGRSDRTPQTSASGGCR